MLQATIAIFLLCGFESVTALGEEAKNPKKDIARGVLLSLTIQGLVCYLFEYFAANYFKSQKRYPSRCSAVDHDPMSVHVSYRVFRG